MKGGRKNLKEKMSTLGRGQSKTEVAITTQFFKIMMPGFKDKMMFPPAFCGKIKEEKQLERAVLKSRKGRYEMEVKRDSNRVYFEGGWSRFVDEHGLSLGDVVVFEHTRQLQFFVGVFCSNECEELYLPITNHHPSASNSAAIRIKSFKLRITDYTVSKKSRVTVPIRFVRANDLDQKERLSLNVGGRKWEVKLWSSETYRFRVLITGGWRRFFQGNELQAGDVCEFKLNPASSSSSSSPTTATMDVHITRAASRYRLYKHYQH